MERLVPSRTGSDRGQLLLVTAFALAVLIVSLATVLNAAVATETTAVQADGPAVERDVAKYQQTVREGVRELVVAVNHDPSVSDPGSALATAVSNWSAMAGIHAAAAGYGTSAEVTDTTIGTRLVQDTDRNFTDAVEPYNETWTLVTDATVRRFYMNVSRGELADTESNAFTITVTGTGGVWNVTVYNDGDDVVVEATGPDGTAQCMVADAPSRVTIDVIAGTVEGEPCDALEPFAAGVQSPYDVTFHRGDAAVGTYELVVDGSVEDGNFDDSPYATPAVYAATVQMSYQELGVEYVTEIRVAPGERDD